MKPNVLNEVLKQRNDTHGSFIDNARLAQILKEYMRQQKNWGRLQLDEREALDNIAQKISRMLTGNKPDYEDNWIDICGYATLIVNRIEESKKK